MVRGLDLATFMIRTCYKFPFLAEVLFVFPTPALTLFMLSTVFFQTFFRWVVNYLVLVMLCRWFKSVLTTFRLSRLILNLVVIYLLLQKIYVILAVVWLIDKHTVSVLDHFPACLSQF